MLNCVYLIKVDDLVLQRVIFSPNFLFFSVFPLSFPSLSPNPLTFFPQLYTGQTIYEEDEQTLDKRHMTSNDNGFGKTISHESNIACIRSLKQNKAGETATPVACGWAGAVFEVT